MACGGPAGGLPGGSGDSRWEPTGIGPVGGRGGAFSVHCQQTCFLLGLLCLLADDFLEPEEYAEPQEAMPGEAADLGRSERGP